MILNFNHNLRMTTRVAVTFLSVSMLLAACGGAETSDGRLRVVATTSILGDIVAEIVGDDVAVDVVIGPGIDPHDFQASARQVELVADADLVVAVGLGLEESLLDVIESQAAGALLLGPELDPIPFLGPDSHEEEDSHEDEDHPDEDDHASADHEHSDALDPHVWLDPVRIAAAVPLIVDRLEALDPELDLQSRADDYIDRLRSLDEEISAVLEPIPDEGRKLVTSHDALGYFAERYDFEVVGVIVAGGTTLAEPSAADLANLADAIEASGVTAIFTDAYNPTTLAEAVASEVDGDVSVVPLITGSLTEEATSYLELMRTNATRIANALGGER